MASAPETGDTEPTSPAEEEKQYLQPKQITHPPEITEPTGHGYLQRVKAGMKNTVSTVSNAFSMTGSGDPKPKSPAEQKEYLLTKLRNHLIEKESVGRLTIYQMPEITEPTGEWEFGKAKAGIKNKVIMMIGETGSGKTSLINTMINYIFGVEWSDNYRIKLIVEKTKAESQTSVITAYQINHEDGLRIPHSITLIDTPGFGETRGIKHDMETMRQIQAFFSRCKFQRIDAICFVISSTQAKLTVTQRYIFDSVLSIFGNDIKENIIFFTTFANQQKPNVLLPINEANIPCARSEVGNPVYFQIDTSMTYVNNSPKEDEGEDEDEDEDTFQINKIQWKRGIKSIDNFFSVFLPNVISKDLDKTKEVLKERIALELTLEGLIHKIEEKAQKQHQLEEAEKALERHKGDIKNYSAVEVTVDELVKTKRESKEERSINCETCSITCHLNCRMYWLYVVWFFLIGSCHKCKCALSQHKHEYYYWEEVYETKTKTVEDITKKFLAQTKATSCEETLQNMKAGIQKSEKEEETLIQEMIKSLKRLEQIALKPKPMSAVEYIEMLIQAEKQEGKRGYQEKIKMLEKTKKKCEILSKYEK